MSLLPAVQQLRVDAASGGALGDLQRHGAALKPRVRVHDGPVQADFSSLRGPTGDEWAEILGRKTLPLSLVPPFTLVRVRFGAYGSRQLADGTVETGGLEREMQQMDSILAELSPAEIHVIHDTPTPMRPYRLSQPHWRGSVTVHPLPLKASGPQRASDAVLDLVKRLQPDLLHIHHPTSAFEEKVIKGLPPDLPLVASYHSVPASPLRLEGVSRLRSAIGLAGKAARRYQQYCEAMSPSRATVQVCKEAADFLVRRLLYGGRAVEQVHSRVAESGGGVYEAFHFTAISEAGKGHVGSREAAIIRPPVDPDFFSPERANPLVAAELRQELNLAPGVPLLVYHARMCTAKGQHLLPAVADAVRAHTSQPFAMVMIGPSFEVGIVTRIQREIARFGVEQQVHLLPGKPATFVRDVLADTAISLFPTLMEGLGLTAVEAQLMRVPVVAHRVGGVPEVVQDNVTGKLVDPGNIGDFA